VLPESEDQQALDFQLKKAGNLTPIDLTIVDLNTEDRLSLNKVMLTIIPHIRRLRSLRIQISDYFFPCLFDALRGDVPLLECLRLRCGFAYFVGIPPPLGINCPRIRILDVRGDLIRSPNYRWVKENMANVESVTISQTSEDFSRALNSIPRRIPCLTLENMRQDSSYLLETIGAEKVILSRSAIPSTLGSIDENCKTIAFHDCNISEIYQLASRGRLPSSNTLEFDRCQTFLPYPREKSFNFAWNGHTVTVLNCDLRSIKVLLEMLTARFMDRSCFMWPRVTTLTLVARGDFIMKFSVKLLKTMISNRREAAVQENLGIAKAEVDDTGYKGVHPIIVLHVHGGPALSRSDRSWFMENVKDFVWDYKKK